MDLVEIVNRAKTSVTKLKYLGKRNLLYEVRMDATKIGNVRKASKEFGDDVVIPEINSYLDGRINFFEGEYLMATSGKFGWEHEPEKDSEGNPNPNYVNKSPNLRMYDNQLKRAENARSLLIELYGTLNKNGIEAYLAALKENEGKIKYRLALKK